MIESGGIGIFLKWILAPIAAMGTMVWWFFKRNEYYTDSKIAQQSSRTDTIERRVSYLERREAEMKTKLEFLIEATKDTKRLLEKLDDKLDKYHGS